MARKRSGETSTGASARRYSATPFMMEVGRPPELESSDALDPVSMGEMIPLNLGALNGAPADQTDEGFFKNLVDEIDAIELATMATNIVQAVERDVVTYSDLDDMMARGVEEMGMDRTNDRRSDPFPGASAVIHPMLAQCVIELVSRSVKEMLPPGGPAKTRIYGKQTDDRVDRADRATKFLNWQLTEQCPEYRTEFEKMLTIVAFTGDGTRKLYWDDDYNRPRSEFINSDQFIVPYGVTDLESAPRYTHAMYLFEDQVKGYMTSGLWKDVNLPKPSAASIMRSKFREKTDKVNAQRPSDDDNDSQYEVYEIHADWHFPSLGDKQMGSVPQDEHADQPPAMEGPLTANDAPDSMIALKDVGAATQPTTGTTDQSGGERKKKPFIITVEHGSKKVLAVRRNWKKTDEKARKRVWFMHYFLFPWTGWRGIGLWHLIGGLQKSATGALRALMDSSALKSMPGGFRLKGARTSGTEIKFKPLDFVEVDAPGATDIREVMMPMPFEGPSPVLMELLGFLVTGGQTFASVATRPVAEMNPNAPVGTTLALIEEGGRVYNAIHTRLHYSQKKELNLLCELNHEHLDDKISVQAFGGEIVAYREDFGGGVGIVPVSDPEISNQVQRLARSDARLNLAMKAKEVGVNANLQLAFRESAKAIGTDNVDEMFPDDQQAQPLDPISELMALVKGKPTDAFPGQNHLAHVAFMRGVANNPQYKMMIEAVAPQFMALGHAHLVMAIKDQIMEQLQIDPNKPIPQEMQQQFATAIAKAAQKLPTEDIFGSNMEQGNQNLAMILGQAARDEILAEREKVRIQEESKIEITKAELAAHKEEMMFELLVKLTLEFAKIDSKENIEAAQLAHDISTKTDEMMERFTKLLHEVNYDTKDLDIKRAAAKKKVAA